MTDNHQLVLLTPFGALLLTILMFIGLFVILRWFSRRSLAQIAKTEACWAEFAGRLEDGQFIAPTGPWFWRPSARVEVVHDGVPLALSWFLWPPGEGATRHTRFQARVDADEKLTFAVFYGYFPLWAKWSLGSDVKVGDDEYDRAFLVKSSNRHWLRTVFSEDWRKLHLEDRQIELRLLHGELWVFKPGLVEETETLARMLDLAVAVALACKSRQREGAQ